MPSTFQSPLLQQLLPSNQSFEGRLQSLEAWMRRSQNSNVVFPSLDQISNDMGVFQVGELIVGTGTPEGGDLSGVAILSNAIAISGTNYNVIGMNAGALQFGLSSDDGKAYFAAGTAIIDANGITILGDSTNLISWKTAAGALMADMFGQKSGGFSGVALEGIGDASNTGYVGMIAYATTGKANWTSINLFHDTGAQIDFTNTVSKATSTRGLVIKDEISANAFSSLLYLDMYRTVAGGVALGAAISWRIKNASSAISDAAYAGARWITPTAGAEDVEFPIAVKVNGTMREIVTITGGGIIMNDNFAGIKTSSLNLANDTATSFNPARSNGLIILGVPQGGSGGIASYHVTAPSCLVLIGGANLAATTGALTGTTGAVGKLTVSAHATDGKIYIENRTGGTRTLYFLLI